MNNDLDYPQLNEKKENETHVLHAQGLYIPFFIINREDLTPTEKFLFGYLHPLSDGKQGCTASNYYISTLLQVSPQTISVGINKLKGLGFIEVYYSNDSKRTVFTRWDNFNEGGTGKPVGGYWKTSRGDTGKPVTKKNIICTTNINTLTSLKYNSESEGFANSKEGDVVKQEQEQEKPKLDRTVDDPPDRAIFDKLHPKPKKEEYIPTTLASAIIDYWSDTGLKNHRKGTRTYEHIAESIDKLARGTLFNHTPFAENYSNRKFTRKEIIDTIKRFSLAALNTEYEPIVLSSKEYLAKISLSDFLYNPYVLNGNKSLFLKYFENPPELAKTRRFSAPKDDHPILTDRLKKWYIAKKHPDAYLFPVKFTDEDDANFIKAIRKLAEFSEKYKEVLPDPRPFFPIYGVTSMLGLMFETFLLCMEDQLRKKDVPIYYLCNDLTFNSIFPDYLKASNITKRTPNYMYESRSERPPSDASFDDDSDS